MNTNEPAKNTPKGTISEAGSSALNAETTAGGADSVPDTPDVNDASRKDVNMPKDDDKNSDQD